MPQWSQWHSQPAASVAAAPGPPGSAAARWHWSPARWLSDRQAWTRGAWHFLEADPPAAAAPADSDPWGRTPHPPGPVGATAPPGSRPGSSWEGGRGYGDYSTSGWWTRAEWEAWQSSRTPAPATAAAGPAEALVQAASGPETVAPLEDVTRWLQSRPARTLAASARRPGSAGPRRQASPGSRGRSTRAPSSAPRPGPVPPGPVPPPEPAAAGSAAAAARRTAGPPPTPVEGDRVPARACLSCDALLGVAFHHTGLYQDDLLCELCGEIEYLRSLVEVYKPSVKERRALRLGVRVLCAQALGSQSEGARAAEGPPPGAPPPSGAGPSPVAPAPVEDPGTQSEQPETAGESSSAAAAPAGNYREPPEWIRRLADQAEEGRIGRVPKAEAP